MRLVSYFPPFQVFVSDMFFLNVGHLLPKVLADEKKRVSKQQTNITEQLRNSQSRLDQQLVLFMDMCTQGSGS